MSMLARIRTSGPACDNLSSGAGPRQLSPAARAFKVQVQVSGSALD
jgi:hypothetical protein